MSFQRKKLCSMCQRFYHDQRYQFCYTCTTDLKIEQGKLVRCTICKEGVHDPKYLMCWECKNDPQIDEGGDPK